ncbi:MAG: hemerythrin [Azonexaceae bacterium]|nr:hemerythrin [Azonexaceae bacterium]
MSESTIFGWHDQFLLGHAEMDETHKEFVELVNALLTVSDAELNSALAAFSAHAERHFAQENEWMEKNDFPPRDCHIDEHNKVLASVHDVQEQLAQGDVAIVRELAKALMDWFPSHADYLDSALATWLVKRTHAGAPLVLRRNPVKA